MKARIHSRWNLVLIVALLTLVFSFTKSNAQSTDTATGVKGDANQSTQNNSEALLRLGDLYLGGNGVTVDLKKAFDYYQQAADAGSDAAAIKVAEMTAVGSGVAPDFKAGLQMVKSIADRGNVEAMVSLGDILSGGDAGPMNPDQSIIAYEKAASLGNVTAMLKLGDIYRGGRFAARDDRKAAAYYRKAADTGDAYGIFALGRFNSESHKGGSLAGHNSQALMQKAAERGVREAAVGQATALFYNFGVRSDVPAAMKILTQSAEQGNLRAIQELIGILRDGRRDGKLLLVRRDTNKARALVANYSTKLTADQKSAELFLIDVSSAPVSTIRALYGRLRQFPKFQQQELVRRLRTISGPAYVRIVQIRLQEIGILRTEPKSMTDFNTSRALKSYCLRTGTRYFCSHGTMSSEIAETISYAF